MLFLDACKAHLHARVFAACAACGLWAVVVPAKMTRLLQPLDTHAFLAYKVYLQKLFQEARIRTANGDLDVAGLLKCICGTAISTLQGCSNASATVSIMSSTGAHGPQPLTGTVGALDRRLFAGES